MTKVYKEDDSLSINSLFHQHQSFETSKWREKLNGNRHYKTNKQKQTNWLIDTQLNKTKKKQKKLVITELR